MEQKNQALENFKEKVMAAAVSNLKRPLTEDEKSHIAKKIDSNSDILTKIPNHPPYAAMIIEAIQGMNSKSGSSEEAISDFIRKKYPELPLHHSVCLKIRLGTLCDRLEILKTANGCYALPNESPELTRPAQITAAIEVQNKPKQKRVRNKPKEKTVLVQEEQKVVANEGQISSIKQRPKGRGRGRGKANKQKEIEYSTSDLILSVVYNTDSQERKQVRGRSRGRGRGRLL